jgi:hypothetical protein
VVAAPAGLRAVLREVVRAVLREVVDRVWPELLSVAM